MKKKTKAVAKMKKMVQEWGKCLTMSNDAEMSSTKIQQSRIHQ